MGRTPRKRETPGVIFIRLPADEYNLAVEEIVVNRHSTFQEHVRNLLLSPTNNKRMVTLLETILREVPVKEGLETKIKNLLLDLKGLR
jgi:hypothetical protein